MTHPYIDCARRLAARGFKAGDIVAMACEVAEGTVNRLWEPLGEKQRPPNGYAAKFSTPYCIAAGFTRGDVGLEAFSDEAVRDPDIRAVAAKVSYRIDPDNPYPRRYTGHIQATLRNGQVVEERQANFRGAFTRADIEEKFFLNARRGGWSRKQAEAALRLARTIYDGKVVLDVLRE
jgi:2-methylcitrate dehydratase PrpD